MTLDVVLLYIAFALTIAAIGWLTARMREHEDLLLDLRFRINDVRESLVSKRTPSGSLQTPASTNDEIARYIDQLGKETHRGHDR